MSSELLGAAQNVLKGNLGGAWDINKGYADAYTDLGIARRFGGAAAAYSLRDIGAMNGRVVEVRRNSDSASEDFSANQVSSGALADFCSTPLTVGTAVNGTSPFDNYTFTANGNTGFDADNSAGGTGSAGFPYTFKNGDVMTVTYTVTNFSSTSGLSPQIRGTTGTDNVTSVASGGTTFTANGTYTDTLTASNNGTHLMFADGNTGSYTISNFAVTSHKTDGFVSKWYDQSGNGRDMSQTTTADQPRVVDTGVVETIGGKPTIKFLNVGTNLGSTFLSNSNYPTANLVMSAYFVASIETTTPDRQTFSGGTSDIGLDADSRVLFRRGGNNRSFSNLTFSINTNSLVVVSNDSSYVPTGRLNGTSQNQVAFAGGAGEKTFEILGENSTTAGNDTFGLQGTMSEAILYNDIEYDADIESDIANYYNITLS